MRTLDAEKRPARASGRPRREGVVQMAFWKRPARWASVEQLLLAMMRDDQWAMVTRRSMSLVVCCCEIDCSDKRNFLIRGKESVTGLHRKRRQRRKPLGIQTVLGIEKM